MIIKNILRFFIAASLFMSCAGFAKVLNLSEAVQLASKNSPKVQKAAAALGEAQWRKVETYNGFLPSVNLSASHLLSKEYQFVDMNFGAALVTVPQIIPSNAWALNVSLPLFEGFSSWNRTSAARLGESAAENEYDWVKFQTDKEVRLRYYQAIAAQKLRGVSEQNLTTLMDHLNQARALKRGGAATSYDVLRVEVQMNEAQGEVLKTEDDMVLARQRLAQTIGSDDRFDELESEMPVPNSEVLKKVRSEDLTTRKDLVALEQKAESTDKMQNAAKAYWVPRLSLNGSWMSYNNRNDDIYDHDAYRWAYNVGLTLNWNIFDIGTIARSQQAIYQRVQMEKTLTQAKLQSGVDYEFWKRRCLYSATIYKAKLSDVEKAQESVRLAKEGYRAGTRTSSDVLDSELELFRSRAGVVSSQMNYAEALTNLELAVGYSL